MVGQEAPPTSRFSRRIAVALAAVALAPMLVPAAFIPAGADTTAALLFSQLPGPRGYGPAVWTGDHVFYFGGFDCSPTYGSCDGFEAYKDDVVRFNPGTGAVDVMSASLWLGNAGSSAVWLESASKVVLFGGYRCIILWVPCDSAAEIFSYDPASDTIQFELAVLPSPRTQTAAVWSGEAAYVFGGVDGGTQFNQILRYDPVLDIVTPMTAVLPTPPGVLGRHGIAAAWNGTHAFLFGGVGGGGLQIEILRYDPFLDEVVPMRARLPVGLAHSAAFSDGDYIYVVGGASSASSFGNDRIFRYHPATDTILTMSSRLPSPREAPAAIWDPTPRAVNGCFAGCAYTLGGMKIGEIVRTTLEPGPPLVPEATWGPGAGNLTLRWDSPAPNTYSSPLTTYRVYRGTSGGAKALVAVVASPERSFLDTGRDVNLRYEYVITAANKYGVGPASVEVAVAPPDPPGAPRALIVSTGPGVGEISLRWTPPLDDGGAPVESYRIWRSETASSPPTLAGVTSGETFTDSSVPNGARRYYRLSAVNVAGEGARSAAVHGVAPSAPSPPTQTRALTGPGGTDAITVSWQPNFNGGLPLTEYRVYRAPYGSAPTLLAVLPGTAISHIDRPVPTGIWAYSVVAVNAAGVSAASNGAYGVAVDLT